MADVTDVGQKRRETEGVWGLTDGDSKPGLSQQMFPLQANSSGWQSCLHTSGCTSGPLPGPLPPCLPWFLICNGHGEADSSVC